MMITKHSPRINTDWPEMWMSAHTAIFLSRIAWIEYKGYSMIRFSAVGTKATRAPGMPRETNRAGPI